MRCHDTLLRDQRIVVMGLGRFGGGVDAAIYAAQQGGRVLVTDLAEPETLAHSLQDLKGFPSIEYCLGTHAEEAFRNADVVVVNPAVPRDSRWLAQAENAAITTQINLFLERCPATVIGITGSNGKSTTAALTAYLLESAAASGSVPYGAVWLGGNIGNRPLLRCLPQMNAEDVVVLELSSFQTEMLASPGMSTKIALITNLTPNHLDRHGTFEDYCAAKETLIRLQSGTESDPSVSLFCKEDAVGREWFEKYRSQQGRTVEGYCAADVPEPLRECFTLPGRANLNNLAGALAIVRCLGVAACQVEEGVATFRSLAHRLEAVAEQGKVRWYNDSIATTPESTMAALDALEAPKVLITGGYDKGMGFLDLGRHIVAQVKAVVLMGQTTGKIADAIAKAGGSPVKVERAASLVEAVNLAAQQAVPGDVVILSPACASYDMFANFEERGNEFRRLVLCLKT